jgi:hypothetical protein
VWVEVIVPPTKGAAMGVGTTTDGDAIVATIGSVGDPGGVARFAASDGTAIWTEVPDSSDLRLWAATVGAGDRAYAAGELRSTLTWAGTVLGGRAGSDPVLLELQSDGSPGAATVFEDTGNGSFTAVTAHMGDGVVAVGFIEGDLVLSDGTHSTAAGSRDAFVSAFTTDGALRWSRHFGGPSEERASGVAVDTTGAVVLVGALDGTMNVDDLPPLVSAGDSDIFAIRIVPTP